ncbi:MAG: hypothetical protein GX308_09000 [Epulopiscium sp.]|nr:hypothetical protein [Candidatus Epulonipiscium sp.]
MVFAVSPMNTPRKYVHPLANSFSDFLCLLLACGDTAALEQAHGWHQKEFDTFLEDNPVTKEQMAVLNIIREKLYLEPMEHPFTYIKQLQAEFDYSKIKFTKDYEDFIPPVPSLPEWKVCFDGNFWGQSGRQRPGKEITVQTHFNLNDKEWHIPSIYSCSSGLIIDFCIKIPAKRITNFIDKWELSPENGGSNFSEQQQEEIETENPITINISPEIVLNGKTISCSHSYKLSWNPCFPELNEIESYGACKHYGLDQNSGWVIWRSAFPWQTKRKPSISSLDVMIKHDPINISSSHFNINAPGERIEFTNPVTNILHIMTVQEYKLQEIPTNMFSDEDYDFPSHCIAMSYTISPDLDDESFSVRDCSSGDKPRKKHRNPMEPQAISDCFAVGIISGAHSLAAITFGDSRQGKLRALCSALHFEPVETVDWKIIFHEKPCHDMTVKLI